MHRCRHSLLLLILLPLLACNEPQPVVQKQLAEKDAQQWASIKLPDLSQQPVNLRVANVINPRFKQLSSHQLQQILIRCQQLVRQHFSVEVVFSDVETLLIADVFRQLKPQVIAARDDEIVDIKSIDKQGREVMQQALFATLSNYVADKKNVLAFAQPYVLHPEVKQQDFIGLSYALVDTLIARLGYWTSIVAADGRPVLDSEGYNEWVWWDSLGYGELPYEVVITNQLIASAENYGLDVHSSIRGGLTAGTTAYNRNAKFESYSYIMLYPMLNDLDLLTELRHDETYASEQIINYAAALLTHELGHMLLHLGHPFGRKACIMSPTVMLDYRDWYDHLDASQCPPGSSSQMEPGAANIDYNRDW